MIKVEDIYKPIYTEDEIENKLVKIYINIKKDSLIDFFKDWNSSIKPNTQEFIDQNDTIKELFNVYKTFYKPYDLLKLGEWEWGNRLNTNCKYYIIQNYMFYSVSINDSIIDQSRNDIKLDSIANFRPPININNKKVLYLTKEYENGLNNFLGVDKVRFGDGDLNKRIEAYEESRKRYFFLKPFVPILPGHWGRYWHLETSPIISQISFNNSLTKAIVDFRVGYEGGEATLIRNGNTWKIVKSKSTWIE